MRSNHIRPRTLWLSIVIAIVLASGVIWGAYFIVVLFFDTPDRPDEVRARTTALVTGLLGAVAIALAILRERVAIRSHNHVQRLELRRILEHEERLRLEHLSDLRGRYVSAAEQLGHPSAAVRIAGANALAALALEWEDPAQRQACVDVLCAYLRMPPMKGLPSGSPHEPPTAHITDPWSGETDPNDRQVRLTIQRLIRTHLLTGSIRHWGEVSIDLSGAWLEDFDANLTTFAGAAVFEKAVFSGTAAFQEAQFTGWHTTFREATFLDVGDFDRAHFSGHIVSFSAVIAKDLLLFPGAHFAAEHALFIGATLEGGVSFAHASFFTSGLVPFIRTVFSGRQANFRDTRFKGGVSFSESLFSSDEVIFRETKFRQASFDAVFASGGVHFIDASFAGKVDFEGAIFMQGPVHRDLPFWGEIRFIRTEFESGSPTTGDGSFFGYPTPEIPQPDPVVA
ncbi:pentapeptide repeat-containing protein [Arthrobacter oryzae]|uniref:pentapeptide repeat-containing protein n=1 Tax=Arthrobacter oryzae TaxID=409290 RepID=UPI00285E3EAA|nr:pentapeptide repeat-containing protein [Arthrobacter oryzae]MDR6507278.1 uncharacterized protein YjbI with pentapeptide repeats [Arthrobacter oryzae]